MLLALVLAASPSVQLDGFPSVTQKEDFCGEAAVEMALRRTGAALTQDDVFNVSGLSPLKGRGVHADELATALRALGVEPGPVWFQSDAQTQWRALYDDLARGVPSIVCMHFDASPDTTEHFRLVSGYDAATDEVIAEDPADGQRHRWKRGEFLKLMAFAPKSKKFNFIRLRVPAPARPPEVPVAERPSPAEVAQHVMALQPTLPKGYQLAWEAPFLIIGPDVKKGLGVVSWTKRLLLKDLFARAPSTLEEVWLFTDAPSYVRYSRELFRMNPDTPYGYYLPGREALVMNVRPGYGTLTHELVHPFVHENWSDAPAWLNEGLGSLFEQPQEREGHFAGGINWRLPHIQGALAARRAPTLAQLTALSDDDFYDDDTGVHYAAARYLCFWLQERGLLQRFVRRAFELKDADTALEEVLGAPLASVQRDYEAFVMGLKRRS